MQILTFDRTLLYVPLSADKSVVF